MKSGAPELRWALVTIVAITAVYLAVVSYLQAVPAAGSLFGHGLGVIGFLLMLSTETLYSIRKRSRQARWGRNATWLRIHIFTGLVGAYLVLIHTSWKFNGLAGLVVLMTVVVVISGFIGRYIYTAVPRSADGLMLEAGDLQLQIDSAEAELQRWLAGHSEISQTQLALLTANARPPDSPTRLVFGRAFVDWRNRWRWRRETARMQEPARSQANQLHALVLRRSALQRQAASLVAARRLLGVWHTIHIPIGVVLFAAAFVHIGAALYYSTFLH